MYRNTVHVDCHLHKWKYDCYNAGQWYWNNFNRLVKSALLMKMPTDFDKYVTAAYYFTRTITVTNLLTPTITIKTEWQLWTICDKRPLLQSKCHTANENTDWLYLIRDCHLLFHKNDYSDEFIDTNYYKQNKQNNDFELYVTKDHFYKAYSTLPMKNTHWLW